MSLLGGKEQNDELILFLRYTLAGEQSLMKISNYEPQGTGQDFEEVLQNLETESMEESKVQHSSCWAIWKATKWHTRNALRVRLMTSLYAFNQNFMSFQCNQTYQYQNCSANSRNYSFSMWILRGHNTLDLSSSYAYNTKTWAGQEMFWQLVWHKVHDSSSPWDFNRATHAQDRKSKGTLVKQKMDLAQNSK